MRADKLLLLLLLLSAAADVSLCSTTERSSFKVLARSDLMLFT